MIPRESRPLLGPAPETSLTTTRDTVTDAGVLALDGGSGESLNVVGVRPRRRRRVPILPDDLTEPVMLRFWRFVELPAEPAKCAQWTGGRDGRHGYGRFQLAGRKVQAARVAWVWAHGESIPEGLEPDHLRRQRACVAPAHLELVTGRINTARGEGRSAATLRAFDERGECVNGHDLTLPGAWYTQPSTGHRRCRVCDWVRRRAWERWGQQDARLFDLPVAVSL
jgi:HNH endonuclease